MTAHTALALPHAPAVTEPARAALRVAIEESPPRSPLQLLRDGPG